MKIKEWFTTLPSPYFLTHNENKVDISKIKISKSGEVVLKTEGEPKKNHWYEMYELECLKTKALLEDLKHKKIAIQTRNKRIKELEKQIEKMNQELEEYKSKDKRNICNHKYFVSDTAHNNMAVVCHTLIDCEKCARYKEN